ncbi:class I SAM-dependent DNA methyltransferase [Hoeflea sp.]|uniref:HsdM family class I SAM-dependent methyltransferase n=1 Tax=Hoeflea sp. TaxID=1940281 RepID=UPI0037480245
MTKSIAPSPNEERTNTSSGPLLQPTALAATQPSVSFATAKTEFDKKHATALTTECIVPVRGQAHGSVSIRSAAGEPLEEYYKWQFINAIVNSGLYSKDYIGVEVHFPKGNKGSAPLKLDGAIFDDKSWIDHYNSYWSSRKPADLEWLSDHLVAVIEFKNGDKEVEKVYTGQIKAAMREKEPSDAFVLGVYYDTERLFIFQRKNGSVLRYDESKNQKGDASKVGDLALHLPDAYQHLPSFAELLKLTNRPSSLDRSSRSITDLDIVASISSVQVQTAFSEVLRALDKAGLVNQRGYVILIQTLALKIFDEKRNAASPHKPLQFYISPQEAGFQTLANVDVQEFIKRLQKIRGEASGQYKKILNNNEIDWKNPGHVRAVAAICSAFQDYSFVRSAKSDLYQLVFYNFANSFKRDEAAQFLTPLPVIDFIVKLVNPREEETVFDPCCGIGDFLSLAFVNASVKQSGWQLNDANIYGVDLDENMITLATLNMLLNGDGEAKLFDKPDRGSIVSKIETSSPTRLVDLLPSEHKNGNWDNWPDKTELMKFDVILTNPPFGEDRAYRVQSQADREILEMYELWNLSRQADTGTKGTKKGGKGDSLDLGILFLENAYRCLKDEGRLGIVLSNSIASINKWVKVRQWLMDKMRIVGLFDLPPNVFAETGVNTSILVAYKPDAKELNALNSNGYSVFVRDIKNVGYERRTSKRNVFFNPLYKIDPATFAVAVDDNGNPVLKEDFTEILSDFQAWSMSQEETLQKLFCREG